MTENATKTICSIRVRLAASRFSLDRVCLFFDFLFAISTDLLHVWKKHLPLPFRVLPMLLASKHMYLRQV